MEPMHRIVYNAAGQLLDIYSPEEDNGKVFLYFHGGGLTGGTREYQPFMGWLWGKGVTVVSASYRLYPDARYPAYIEDAADAVAWVIRNMPGKEVYVGGSSAGAYISMMLCFDERYLRKRRLHRDQIRGFVHNAGQPTTHFAVLRERGMDERRVVVDEAAPLFHITPGEVYPPMVFLTADNDIPCRLEQTKLMLAAMEHMGCNGNARLEVLAGLHVAYDNAYDENGDSVFGKRILELMEGEKSHA